MKNWNAIAIGAPAANPYLRGRAVAFIAQPTMNQLPNLTIIQTH
jgi:hypothetical protein